MTPQQEATLRRLCASYCVPFDPAHYRVYPADSWMMPGWAEGWIGGPNWARIYVGVSPTGEANS